MMEEVDGFFVFDPSSGSICTACNVPIRMPEGWSLNRCIRNHEGTDQHLKSGRRSTTEEERAHVSACFNNFMEDCVSRVQKCMPCHNLAKQEFIGLVGLPKDYDYCTSCKVLTVNKKNHNNRKCTDKFGSPQLGVKNALWNIGNPKIIIVDDLNLCDYT